MTERPWLPLLEDLYARTRTWTVWKGPESALDGDGDVDSFASQREWPAVVEAFRRWARSHGLGPVIRCTHYPGLLILVACAGDDPAHLIQLDVYSRQLFRGSTLVNAEELVGLTVPDPRGFRRLRPGAEGLLRLLRRLPRSGGAPKLGPDDPIAELLREDPVGAATLAVLVGFPRSLLEGLATGGWDRRPAALFELRSAARLLGHPSQLAACLALDYRRLAGCTLTTALEGGRRVDGDRSRWLAQIGRTHSVEAG
jgi:hypothetical protein